MSTQTSHERKAATEPTGKIRLPGGHVPRSPASLAPQESPHPEYMEIVKKNVMEHAGLWKSLARL